MSAAFRAQPRAESGIAPSAAPRFDLLDVPVLGALLRRPATRWILRSAMLILAVAMMLHGWFGQQWAPKNLATSLTWVHYRGALLLALLVAGNFFCMVCPFMLPRDIARRFIRPRWNWPSRLRNKWPALALFVLILFFYELFDLWSSPWWTAWLIAGYFAAVLGVDLLFKGASFCKFVCPLGQFNFASSTLSPLEVKVRDTAACSTCSTADCIKGRRDEQRTVVKRGCELSLFQPAKIGNLDCTFCMDCVYACPRDNIGIVARLPGSELAGDARRSGIGRLSQRRDLSALAVVFTFGALLNALGMVSPVYAIETWLANLIGTRVEAPVLAILFVFVLVVEPVVLLGGAAYMTRRALGSDEKLLRIAGRYVFALVPLGFATWLAHYSFHFFTGLGTIAPAAQQALIDIGLAVPGRSLWSWRGMAPAAVLPMQVGFIGLGLAGSLAVAHRIASEEIAALRLRAFAPWAVLCVLLAVCAAWLLTQPMEMRSTFL
jgi:ferredoxin